MAPKGQKGLSFTEQKSKGVSKPSISKQSTASSHQSSNKPPSGAQAQKNQASPAKPPSKPEDPAEKMLRGFDLTSKYGPCVGMTRLARWERAQRFGKSPPQEVKDALLAADAPNSRQNCIWHNRV